MLRILHHRCPLRLLTRQVSTSTLASAALPPYRILFCGTDEFAKTALAALHDAKDVCSSLTVLAAGDAPNQWSSRKRSAVAPVKLWAQQVGLPLQTVPRSGINEWRAPREFHERRPDNLLVTASFGHLIPPALLALFPACQRLNLHPSLLPELSGAAPIQWAIARQFTQTGVSVQTLGEQFDSGNIYAQEEVPVPGGSNYHSLEALLAQHGSHLLLRVLRNLDELARQSWPQSAAPPHLPPSRAPKLRRSFSEVKWDRWTSSEVAARHCGFGYLYPLVTSLARSNRILLREVSAVSDAEVSPIPPAFASTLLPGTAVYSPQLESLLVRCKDGNSLLRIKRLQNEGKREMEAARWIVGYRDRSDGNGLLRFV